MQHIRWDAPKEEEDRLIQQSQLYDAVTRRFL